MVKCNFNSQFTSDLNYNQPCTFEAKYFFTYYYVNYFTQETIIWAWCEENHKPNFSKLVRKNYHKRSKQDYLLQQLENIIK